MKLLLLLLTKCFQLAKVKLMYFNCYYLILILTVFVHLISHVALILSKQYKEAYATCEKMSDYIINEAEKKLGRSINPYDIKLKCPVPGCFNISNVRVSLSLFLLSLVLLSLQLTAFLNRSDIHEELGVGSHQWQMCSDIVGKHVRDEVLALLIINFTFLAY